MLVLLFSAFFNSLVNIEQIVKRLYRQYLKKEKVYCYNATHNNL
jgi:hypothetical protein